MISDWGWEGSGGGEGRGKAKVMVGEVTERRGDEKGGGIERKVIEDCGK
jgi:hypothetical protein